MLHTQCRMHPAYLQMQTSALVEHMSQGCTCWLQALYNEQPETWISCLDESFLEELVDISEELDCESVQQLAEAGLQTD